MFQSLLLKKKMLKYMVDIQYSNIYKLHTKYIKIQNISLFTHIYILGGITFSIVVNIRGIFFIL